MSASRDPGGTSGRALPPAYYATRRGPVADWWTLLHPPYTAWHISHAAIGAALAPELDLFRLGLTLMAFFLAVGVAAHALDELNGRPLGTSIPRPALWVVALVSLAGAVGLGVVGIVLVGWWVAAFIVVGALLVPAYNLEWFAGRVHTDNGFAAAWGAFPVLTGYYAQAERLDVTALVAAAAIFALTRAQRTLSTPARQIRRRTRRVQVHLEASNGQECQGGAELLLQPLEGALRALSWAMVLLALALVARHFL